MDTNHQRQHSANGAEQRTSAEVLADAIRVLTEAARLRRSEVPRDDDGQWRKNPNATRPADWAEFVTQALAGAAANVGSVDAALAGRPGSWEADAIRNLLHSTVGYDEQYLLEHRTEPLHVAVNVEQILTDLDIAWLYDDAEAALDQMESDAAATFDYTPYYWTYTRADNGQFVADDSDSPAWSIEAWRASLAATEPLDSDTANEVEHYVLNGPARSAYIVKSPEAAREIARLAGQEDAILADFQARFDALAAQRAREWATYAEAFAANVRREAERLYPGRPVEIELNMTGPTDDAAEDDLGIDDRLEAHLVEFALRHTPLPGSGLTPDDYPVGNSIHATETAAGRLPHLRLPDSSGAHERR